MAFDATGGGTLAFEIIKAMETAATMKGSQRSNYGSNTFKKLYIYGGLNAGKPLTLKPFAGMGGQSVADCVYCMCGVSICVYNKSINANIRVPLDSMLLIYVMIGFTWSISGFLLGSGYAAISDEDKKRVAQEISTTFATTYAQRLSLEVQILLSLCYG